MAKHQQRPPRLHGAGETLGGVKNSLILLLMCSTLEHRSVVVVVIIIIVIIVAATRQWGSQGCWGGHSVCPGNIPYCISMASSGLSVTAQDELEL